MCLFSYVHFERELERSLYSPKAEANLLMLHSQIPPELSDAISTWPDVKNWVDRKGLKNQETDKILRPIFKSLKSDPSEEWNSALLYLFLVPIHKTLGYLSRLDSRDQVLSELQWDFIQAIHRIDLEKREERLGQKIINDTQNYTKARYKSFRNRPEITLNDDEDDFFGGVPSKYVDLARSELEIDKAWAIARLKTFVKNGLLSRVDFQILLGCHLYGRSIDEMAIHLGAKYGVVKKRRQRAEKKLKKNAPGMSPTDPDSPLYPLERTAKKEVGHAAKLSLSRNRK